MATGRTVWRPSRRSDAFDLAVAAALALAGALSLYISGDPAVVGPLAGYSRGLGIGGVFVPILALVVRRRYPLVTLVVATAGLSVLRLADVPEYQVAGVVLFVALYTAGAYGGTRRDAVRAMVALVVVALVVWAILREPPVPFEGRVPVVVLDLFTAVSNAFYLAAGWILGDLVRTRRQREARLEAQTAELAAAQAERAHQAVLAERVRIARELHDVLAHHVSMMGVEAGAARRVLASRPDEVPGLLGGIEWSSRQAVVELQRLVGLLRQPGDDPLESPQPTLTRLTDLAEHMREAGLDVHVELDGAVGDPSIPAGVELAVYRIVQESLTNTLKHAGEGATATVEVRREASALALVVADDGRSKGGGAGSGGDSSGHGLVGMRERAALHGGELRAGRASGGGFEVRAWFPLEARSATAGAGS